jgi:cytochrome c
MVRTIRGSILIGLASFLLLYACNGEQKPVSKQENNTATIIGEPTDTSSIPNDQYGAMVRYGRDLILNTASYLGPEGTKGHYLKNKMNCSNCHLDAGTKPFGLNFYNTHARYPQYRGREDRVMTIQERVNNCVERPHNGDPLPLDKLEMVAIVTYIQWVGQNSMVGKQIQGDKSLPLSFPSRAADPYKGQRIYEAQCSVCHGNDGQGLLTTSGDTYLYPPLWGKYAYEKGSSMHRNLKAAEFIKANMPKGKTTWQKPFLSDEECFDVAAFINDDELHTRPVKRNVINYPNLNTKPIDYAEGPFKDTFSLSQHKLGPYRPIIDYYQQKGYRVIL